MVIELQRRWIPASVAEACGVCGLALEDSSVLAMVRTDYGEDAGQACSSCVEYLGRRNPERFPTTLEYRELLARYPEPMYPNMEELEREGARAGYIDAAQLAARDHAVWSYETHREDFTLDCSFSPIYSKREEG